MTKARLLRILRRGVGAWNLERKRNPDLKPDLEGADLTGLGLKGAADFSGAHLGKANLSGLSLVGSDFKGAILRGACLDRAGFERADFSGADLGDARLTGADLLRAVLRDARLQNAVLPRASLFGANLEGADLHGADLKKADLNGADLHGADLSGADLTGASLVGAYLFGANLNKACFQAADLLDANLQQTNMVATDFRKARLSNCLLYGASIWDARLEGSVQSGLVVTPSDTPAVIVDRIEMAPFIHLLLGSRTSQRYARVVLVLGHFTAHRKAVAEGIQEQIRSLEYTPVLVDFERADALGLAAIVANLARVARFVILDLTDTPVSYAGVLALLENVPVPVKPLLMKQDAAVRGPWPGLPEPRLPLLDLYLYEDAPELVANFRKEVIGPAEAKRSALPAPN